MKNLNKELNTIVRMACDYDGINYDRALVEGFEVDIDDLLRITGWMDMEMVKVFICGHFVGYAEKDGDLAEFLEGKLYHYIENYNDGIIDTMPFYELDAEDIENIDSNGYVVLDLGYGFHIDELVVVEI